MKRAYIGLGANLGSPPDQLRTALVHLAELGTVTSVSPFYRSAPMGPTDQPHFCNAVCALDTTLAADVLMQALLDIERRMGRVREVKWGPRLIDLDLLHVEGETWSSEALRLPHPGIAQRDFVLIPWSTIAADAVIPGVGRIGDAARVVERTDLEIWRDV